LKSANISQIRLIFRKAEGFCKFACFFWLQIFVCIFSSILIEYAPIFFIGAIVLTLGLR
jgi:hypothetical protein